jgi:hypothetical protein
MDTTRRSLVTHYCPISVTPNYQRFSETFAMLKVKRGCHISARHYDLRQHAENRLPFSSGLLSPVLGRRLKPSFMGNANA